MKPLESRYSPAMRMLFVSITESDEFGGAAAFETTA